MNTRLIGFGVSVRALAAACMLVIGLAGCESKVTQVNYDQVTVGMTMGEVERLLGSGTLDAQPAGVSISSAGVGDIAAGSKEETYTWRERWGATHDLTAATLRVYFVPRRRPMPSGVRACSSVG